MLKYNMFFLILVVASYSCSPVKENDLYGTYIARYSFGTEKVSLNADGIYIQEVTIDGHPNALGHTGRWRYEPRDRYVELENAFDVADPAGGLKRNFDVPFGGLVLMKIRGDFPSIKLGTVYEDVDFEKIR